MTIPRILHQVWLQGEPPQHLQRLSSRVKGLHPDWEYRLWSRDDYGPLINETIFSELCALGRRDCACDLLRYEILANHGGVYLDLDFFLLKPLDELCTGPEPTLSIEYHGLYTNAFIAVAPHHPLLWDAVRTIPERFASWKHCGGDLLDATGPPFITSLIAEGGYRVNLLPEQLLLQYKCESIVSPEALRQYEYGVHLWGHQGPDAVAERVRTLEILSSRGEGGGGQ